jgi:hypothetical protein
MTCAEGLPIPPDRMGFPAGFPAHLPPDGSMQSYFGDDKVMDDMVEIYSDKHEAAIAAAPPFFDRRIKMARFNAQARFDRRLFASEMKAVWEFDLLQFKSSDSKLEDVTPIQADLEYASYLDYMNEKMTLYDDDYRARATLFKKELEGDCQARPLSAHERAQLDSESLSRQFRTQELWKGLARLRILRAQSDLNNPSRVPCGWPHPLPSLSDPPLDVSEPIVNPSITGELPSRKIFMTTKTIRRVLNFKENIMKYGVFVPRNDAEANASPEVLRWDSGRQLEWLRLQVQGTFERNWDWERVIKQFPHYNKADIGHVFFIYDFKFSGEHRVRLVFDGSKQNPETYTETYAPTARGESVRLFHIVAVEEAYTIAQYDVPQAFLKSPIDCVIFVYPPRNFSEFPGQLLKLKLSLYGAKQSAALWNSMIDGFLQGLGFTPSPLDPCFYKRSDALIILFCDDLRVAAVPSVLKEIHLALYEKFQITTSDGTRFLGMDTVYDLKLGRLKIHMETYITSIHERFHSFDISQGVPFREIVGCLLWVCLCVMGTELLRVKDLARRSNSYTVEDYKVALKVLDRIYERRTYGIVITRGGAGTEIVPSASRDPDHEPASAIAAHQQGKDNTGDITLINEMREKALYKIKEDIADVDISPIVLPVNDRYKLVIYTDASFGVGVTMQSVSGFIVYLNGTPLLWGSLKQTIVVDSSCSAEYVAASVSCKQAIHAENMIGFLGFSCSKPYVMYTDSTACLAIATNAFKLGNVRHLAIRYNLVRCYISIGDIHMLYCITEEMVADLMTKIVDAHQDARLTVRFYCLCPSGFKFVIKHPVHNLE